MDRDKLEIMVEERIQQIKSRVRLPTDLLHQEKLRNLILSDDMEIILSIVLHNRVFNIVDPMMNNIDMDIENVRIEQGKYRGVENAISMMLSYALAMDESEN